MSCMVLTRSMATNNNQEGEPCTTALERQVQTLAEVVECLTQQNHDLEEQLHQRNAGPNNQGEEQEGTSPQYIAKRRDREGLEGSNALSKQERQDTSCPFVADTAPPHMVCRDADDEGNDGLHDNRPQGTGVKRPRQASSPDRFTLYSARHYIPPSSKVSYATDRSL